jgi:hypothetical protein
MGIVKGLKAINKHVEAEEAKFSGGGTSDAPKTKWFSLKDKQAVKVLFLQELDEDSENFSLKNDIGFLATEHQNPDNFKLKAVCSADEGQCYGCEMHDLKGWKAGWKQKTRLYINVLVDDGVNEPYVAVLSQGNGPKSITPALLEYAGLVGTITDKWYRIKRDGSGQTDTSYLLMPLAPSDKNVEDYELFDLEKVVRQVPYEEQAAHYTRGISEEVAAANPRESVGAAAPTNDSVNSEW